jgi:hypothetical protein
MLMLLDIFAALFAVSAAVVWLSARDKPLPDGDHRQAALRRSFQRRRVLAKYSPLSRSRGSHR